MLWVLLLLTLVESKVHILQSDQMFLENHPINESMAVHESDLIDITHEVWKEITTVCPGIMKNASIDVFFDYTLEDTGTLAWNTHPMKVLNGILKAKRDYMTIGVNPHPTNGWFFGENCTDISYRYDLRSVLRHEILHGLGIASSIYKTNNIWTVGFNVNDNCYPTQYDSLITDIVGDRVVEGCTLKKNINGQKVFINDVQLFNPISYNPSSFSHHTYDGGLMYWRLSPSKCMYIEEHETKMLKALGIDCQYTARDQQSVALLLAPLMLSLFFPLL
tara:strand:- start:4165 stop:4992 length:828 start_codon:yes stop_codon:yes gene_type:complete